MAESDESEERLALQRIKEKSEDDFEKYITYISAGGLALSLTFTEKIIPFKDSSYIGFLILGWSLLALTLIVNLISHYTSKIALDKTMEDLDNNDPNLLENYYRRNNLIEWINISTIVTLIVGIFSIILFVSFNAVDMSKSTDPNEIRYESSSKKEAEGGRSIPKPKQPKEKDKSSDSKKNTKK